MRSRGGAARVQPPESTPVGLQQKKIWTLNIHAAAALRVGPALNITQSALNAKYKTLNIHAARRALRVFSQPESHAVGPPTQNK
jgi:hypothetical protein